VTYFHPQLHAHFEPFICVQRHVLLQMATGVSPLEYSRDSSGVELTASGLDRFATSLSFDFFMTYTTSLVTAQAFAKASLAYLRFD
jgi:hypothetical protein